MNIYTLPQICISLPLTGFHEDTLVFALRFFLTKFQWIKGFFPKTDISYLLHSPKNGVIPEGDFSADRVEYSGP